MLTQNKQAKRKINKKCGRKQLAVACCASRVLIDFSQMPTLNKQVKRKINK